LTAKELTALEDQIGHEQTLVKKYEAMACLCTDTKIQQDFGSIANKHRQHYNTLVGFLQ
jgi:rubrerythrin